MGQHVAEHSVSQTLASRLGGGESARAEGIFADSLSCACAALRPDADAPASIVDHFRKLRRSEQEACSGKAAWSDDIVGSGFDC